MYFGKHIEWILLAVVFGIALSSHSFANRFQTETSSSTRALGMGNAAINTERGTYSTFYNPANLAVKATGSYFQFTNFQLDANQGWVEQAGRSKYENIHSLSNMYKHLINARGVYASARYSVFPNLTIRNLSLGLLYERNQGAMVDRNDAQDGAVFIRARNRFAPVASLSFRLFSGVLRLGASAQYLTVGDADKVLSPPIDTGALSFANHVESAAGVVITGGVTLTLPFRFLPSFSVVARNMGKTRFRKPPVVKFGNTRNVSDQPMTVDLATGWTIYLANRMELKLEGDYRDFYHTLRGGRMQHVFAGAELIFFDFLLLRGGYMHGYPTGGLGLKTRKATLDLAWYSDEFSGRLRTKRDQHFVLQYTFNIFGGFK